MTFSGTQDLVSPRYEPLHLREDRLLEADGRLHGEEAVQGGVAGDATPQAQGAPGPQAEVGEEVLGPPQAEASDGEGGGQAAQEALVVVDHPGTLARVIDLGVPGDVGVPQRTPGLCFGDRHDLLLLGLPLLCASKAVLGGGARRAPPLFL